MDEDDNEPETVMDDNDVEPQEDELSAEPDGHGSEPLCRRPSLMSLSWQASCSARQEVRGRGLCVDASHGASDRSREISVSTVPSNRRALARCLDGART